MGATRAYTRKILFLGVIECGSVVGAGWRPWNGEGDPTRLEWGGDERTNIFGVWKNLCCRIEEGGSRHRAYLRVDLRV